MLAAGRFGPMYLGVDSASDQLAVVRTFTDPLTAVQQHALVDALRRLCDTPLDHAAIGRPLECGLEAGVPYLVHEYVPGKAVDAFLAAHGPRPLSEVAVRVTHLAGAIDFAAAAGVHHGALGPHDVSFAPDSSAVAGFGLVQALREAGVTINAPTRVDDIYALGAMTYELLVGHAFTGGDVRDGILTVPGTEPRVVDSLVEALESVLSPDPSRWPATALQFASSLHAAQRLEPPAAGRLTFDGALLEFGEDDGGPRPPVESPMTIPEDAGFVATRAEPETGRLLFDAPLREADPAPALGRAELQPRFGHHEPQVDVEYGQGVMPVATQYSDDEADTVRLTRAGRGDAGVPPPPFTLASAHTSSPSGWRVASISALVALIVVGAVLAGLFVMGGPRRTPAVFEEQAAAPAPRTEVDDDTIGGDPLASGAVPAAQAGATDSGVSSPAVPGGATGSERPDAAAAGVPPAAAPVPETIPRAGDPVGGGTAVEARTIPSLADAVLATTGRVLIRSNPPGALVHVDGQPRGGTPLAVRGLELGPHTIAVSAPGFPGWERRVTLTAERPSHSFEIALGVDGPSDPVGTVGTVPGAVQIDSRPSGAQVWMDGALIGTTPLLVSGVDSGSHAVRIELPGYRLWTTSVEVTRGERARVAASLER